MLKPWNGSIICMPKWKKSGWNSRCFHPDDSWDSQSEGENIIHLRNLWYVWHIHACPWLQETCYKFRFNLIESLWYERHILNCFSFCDTGNLSDVNLIIHLWQIQPQSWRSFSTWLTLKPTWSIQYPVTDITKEKLVEIIKGLLGTDADLNFLVKLDEDELETLVSCIRDRIDQVWK